MKQTIDSLMALDKKALIGGAVGAAALYFAAKHFKQKQSIRIAAGVAGLVGGAYAASMIINKPVAAVSAPATTA